MYSLEMDFFKDKEDPLRILVTGENENHFRDWLLYMIDALEIPTKIQFVTKREEWYYLVKTDNTKTECIRVIIQSDSVCWQKGYWYEFSTKGWSDRYWQTIDTLQEYGGEPLGISGNETENERDELYKEMVKLSDFIAKIIAEELLKIEATPSVDNIVTLGRKLDWHMLKPIDEENSDTWEPSKDNLKLYSGKIKRYYKELST